MAVITCRAYRPDELGAIMEQALQTATAQVVAREAPAAGHDALATQLYRMYEGTLKTPLATLLVADWPPPAAGTGPAGYVLLLPQANPFTGEAEAVVMDIFTNPALRGRGVGRAMLREAGRYAASIGAKSLVAQVALHNRASLAMFLGEGFQGERVVLGKRL